MTLNRIPNSGAEVDGGRPSMLLSKEKGRDGTANVRLPFDTYLCCLQTSAALAAWFYWRLQSWWALDGPDLNLACKQVYANEGDRWKNCT
jgi:hypothetical protein